MYDINEGPTYVYTITRCRVYTTKPLVTLIITVTITSRITGVTHNSPSLLALDSVTPRIVNARTSEYAHAYPAHTLTLGFVPQGAAQSHYCPADQIDAGWCGSWLVILVCFICVLAGSYFWMDTYYKFHYVHKCVNNYVYIITYSHTRICPLLVSATSHSRRARLHGCGHLW